jgi:hypothetical protein
MPVTDSAKLDYLWKKLGYGVAKTAPPDNKEAFNESIPSPLLYRGDLVMVDSGSIPAVIPNTSSSIVEVYKDNSSGNSWTATVECTEDLTSPDNRTWKTNLQNWIPTQFGSTYLVKVYVANAAVSNPQTVGVQLFQAGSGNDDEWFFDYQAGVLNFNGINIPSVIGTGITGKSVYVSGARYVGPFGVSGSNGIGNLTVSNTTISTNVANGNITLTANGLGLVQVSGTAGLVIPSGNTTQRPSPALTGTIRINTELGQIEGWDGNTWVSGTGFNITNETLNGDGSTVSFALNRTTTTAGTLIMLNGVVQLPTTSYAVVPSPGNTLVFTEAPVSTDVIDVRYL